jgi:long-chain acyl-CoA synthetase
MNFKEYLANLEQYGDRVALTIRPELRRRSLTYGELVARSYQTAHYLLSLGIKKNDRVMIISPSKPEWVVVFLACQCLGVTLVPVDAQSSSKTIKIYIEQIEPQLIFVSQVIVNIRGGIILEDLYQLIAGQSSEVPAVTLSGQETAVIVFTSGTTAAPKGVMISQQAILSDFDGLNQVLVIAPDWRFLSLLPLSHMYELTAGCLAPLSQGASIYYINRLTPSVINEALIDYGITTILAVPELANIFLDRIEQLARQSGQLRKLRNTRKLAKHLPIAVRRCIFHKVIAGLGGHLSVIATGGAPINPEVALSWERMGIKMIEGYGLTETAPILTMNSLQERRFGSQGKVIPTTQLRIAPDGEIQAHGDNLFTGYWKNKAATQEAFTADGWFKTGDVGKLSNGWLYIQGRAKFAIVLNSGLKVFPEDIEQVAEKNPLLKQLCIVGIKNADGEIVKAVIISTASDAAIEKALQHINGQLESFQHIQDWIRWHEPEFPRTRLLKIDRKTVQQWANSHHADSRDDAQQYEHEDKLVVIIRKLLKKPTLRVNETDVLADMGLDSLHRLTLLSMIEERFNVAIPEQYITQTTTLKQLRHLVSQKSSSNSSDRKLPTWPYNPVIHAVGNLLRNSLVAIFIPIWVRKEVHGSERLDAINGPAIFIFNHLDGGDVPILYSVLPKRVKNHMAIAFGEDVMKKMPMIALLARFLYAAFPFARKQPFTPTFKYTGRLVDKGWNIALSPEGRLSRDGTLQSFKTGIGLLATQLDIPVIAVKTEGLYGTVPIGKKWPQKRSRIKVYISEPQSFHATDDYEVVTKSLYDMMTDLGKDD